MKFPVIYIVCLSLLVAPIASAYPSDGPNAVVRLTPRATSILNNPDAQPDLPSASQAQAAAAAASLNLDDIQSDILIGMKKNTELLFFFGIIDPVTFKSKLHTDIQPRITTTTQILSVASQPITAINVAFSNTGLLALGLNDSLGDSLFTAGQASDASNLGDPGTTNWIPGFVGTKVHGVFVLASDTMDNVNNTMTDLQNILGTAIVEIYRLGGAARPGSNEGHEHFGFMDGISQPAINGFTSSPTPGQQVLDPGIFLLGETGDTTVRPAWAKDGSFLAFRQLKQLVPEFNKFLTDNPIVEPGLTTDQGSALLGARMVGRWKSGAPVDLAPLVDNPQLAADPNQNNNFTFAHPGEDILSNQTRCPFSAHIRKTRPRADFSPVMNTINHIIRAGIPYGPEVTAAESTSGISDTSLERGLAFVAYQSNIGNGFHFLQRAWANNPNFFFGKSDPTPGVDPIIGALGGSQRVVSGLVPTNPNQDTTLVTDFVVSRGGEYFFSPSVSSILNIISV